MKKGLKITTILFVLSLIILSDNHSRTLAQTEKPTPSATTKASSPSADIGDETIKLLKEKIATKVAQLGEKNKQVVTGIIDKKEADIVEIKSEEKTFKVATDDLLTNIYSINNNSLGKITREDLKKDDFIIVVGPLIGNSINATNIYRDQPYIVGSGEIVEVNKKDYSLKVITQEKDEYLLDIETTTKQSILDIKTFNIEGSGFSKIKQGDTIHFVFKKPKEEKFTRASALRTLIIPQEYFIKPLSK